MRSACGEAARKLEGVRATVNLATGTARVSHPPRIRPGELVATVERAGYTAVLPEPPRARGREQAAANDREQAAANDRDREQAAANDRERLLVTALLAVPVLVLSMVPALQFRNWRDAVLRLAGAVEQGSEHPLGRAITAYARRTLPEQPLPDAGDFRALPGRGVHGRVDGRLVEALAPDDELPAALADALPAAEAAAHRLVLVRVDGAAEALIEVGDVVRPGSCRTVDRLRRLGVRPVLVTGDREAPARAVAAALGMDEVHARCSPEDKADLVRQLRSDRLRVAVVGDGVNDAAALAGADLGIAMGSGTDAAIGTADVTLVRGDIEALGDAVRLARRTLGTIRANLVWAFGYNVVTVPLAMVGLLDPMVAAAAMSLSSLLVVGNSLRLRAWQPAPARSRRPSWPQGRTLSPARSRYR